MVIVLTSRGNYAKFKKIIELSDPELIIGGELLLNDRSVPFNLDGRKVYFNLSGDTLDVMGRSVSIAINEFCAAFSEMKPDNVLLVGDRFETFAAATAAYICNIPIAHLEGGEVSGTLDNAFRYAISEFATWHFPCTEQSAENLKNRGYKNVHMVGATSLDSMSTEFNSFDELQQESGSGPIIDTKLPYLVVIYHPDTSNYNDTEFEIDCLLLAIDALKMPTFWLNSNLDAGSGIIRHKLRTYRDQCRPDFIHFFKSLPIEHYGPLLANAKCIVGNSSSGIRESSFFGVPNVCIGRRQSRREASANTLFTSPKEILSAIEYQSQKRFTVSKKYGDGKASEQILKILRG